MINTINYLHELKSKYTSTIEGDSILEDLIYFLEEANAGFEEGDIDIKSILVNLGDIK